MSSTENLKPGLKGTAELIVGEEHTAPRVGSGRVHVLATPVGMRVRAEVEVVKVEGRTVSFRVTVSDEKEPIGDGTHERMVVNVARFDVRVQDKVAMVRGRA